MGIQQTLAPGALCGEYRALPLRHVDCSASRRAGVSPIFSLPASPRWLDERVLRQPEGFQLLPSERLTGRLAARCKRAHSFSATMRHYRALERRDHVSACFGQGGTGGVEGVCHPA